MKTIIQKNISDSSDEKISLINKNCEILENYDEEEAMIYIEMLEKYADRPQDQERVKFEIEVNHMKPSHLKEWEEMI